MKNPPNYQDTAWKNILDAFFPDSIEFRYPEIYPFVDWDKLVEELDPEFLATSKYSETRGLILDDLRKVHLKGSEGKTLIFHTEIQSSREKNFGQRMFTYFCQTFLKYRENTVSCAILTDSDIHWRPSGYDLGLHDSFFNHYRFGVTKLSDYQAQKESLQANKNPYARALLIHTLASEVKDKSIEVRYETKLAIILALYEQGFFSPYQIGVLYTFTDWLISLPKELELKLNAYICEKERRMGMRYKPYVSTIERMGIEQGLKQGKVEGELTLLLRLLARRFGVLSAEQTARLKQADASQLLVWGERIFDVDRVDDLFLEPA